jgi:hypothetical protein
VKGRELERLNRRYVEPIIPGFVAHRSLVLRQPLGDVLAGLAFDSSAFSATAFDVSAFVQPLYLPAEYVILSFGHHQFAFGDLEKAPEEEVYASLTDAIRKYAVPIFDRVQTPLDLAYVAPTLWYRDGRDTQEVVGLSFAAAGELDRARDVLSQLAARERDEPDERRPDLSAARLARVEEVVAALADGQKATATLLALWREETIDALRLRALA